MAAVMGKNLPAGATMALAERAASGISMTMSTDQSAGPKSAAERMRLYRKRRREGMQYVPIPLHVTEIDDLIRRRLLKEEQRRDVEALQAAVLGLVYRECEKAM
jgi:hypothetical protein